MNWLEIGCPYCPTVLTVPRAAAGRTVRCPECGKSYIVPEPKYASSAYEVTTPLPMLPASLEEVEFEEFAAAAVAKPAVVASATLVPQAAPSAPVPASVPQREPSPPQPAHPLPTQPPAPSAQAEPVAATAPPSAVPLVTPTPTPTVPRVRRRSTADELMYPELEKDSPLPEVEILPPPGSASQRSHQPAASQPTTVQPSASGEVPPPGYDAHGTQTLAAGHPPHNPALTPAEEAAATEEVKQRIRRHQIKALINLAAFVVGILVMTAFAFLVVRFSRPS